LRRPFGHEPGRLVAGDEGRGPPLGRPLVLDSQRSDRARRAGTPAPRKPGPRRHELERLVDVNGSSRSCATRAAPIVPAALPPVTEVPGDPLAWSERSEPGGSPGAVVTPALAVAVDVAVDVPAVDLAPPLSRGGCKGGAARSAGRLTAFCQTRFPRVSEPPPLTPPPSVLGSCAG
jgi:hypothetical protein